MRRFGRVLSYLGLALGGLLGLSMLLPWHLVGISWIVGVGLAKLTFAAALGLIAGGAIMQRVAIRNAERAQLPPHADHTP